MLEYIVNDFGLNPKPKAIVFTEGEEWRALGHLYAEIGAHPSFSGIEFRSIGGTGAFTLQNWQTFIEYMHEKQTLIYFVVDREGHAAREARKLLKSSRRFSYPGLSKVIPRADRLCVWESSFEEANFTDSEIAAAFGRQNVSCEPSQVSALRGKPKGLVKAVAAELGAVIDKKQLVIDLTELLVAWRRKNPDEAMRPVEKFVWDSGQLIIFNHQPVDPESREHNLATGLLG